MTGMYHKVPWYVMVSQVTCYRMLSNKYGMIFIQDKIILYRPQYLLYIHQKY